MSVTPTRNAYQGPNGQWFAPTEDFGYGPNPYDPETEPALYTQWAFQHQGDAQQIGQDYNAKRVAAIIASTLVPYNTGGPAFAGAGAGAGAGAAVPGALTVPTQTGTLAGLTLPGATSLPAATLPVLAGTIPTATGVLPATLPGATSLPAAALPAAAVPAVRGFQNYGPQPGDPGQSSANGSPYAPAPPGAGAPSSFMNALQRYGIPLAATAVTTYLNNRASNQAQSELTTANTLAQDQNRETYRETAGTLNSLYSGQQRQLGEIYAGQQAAMSPYTSLGSGAASLLGGGLGIPVKLPPTTPISAKPIDVATVPGLYPQQLAPHTSATQTTIPAQPGIPQVPFPGQAANTTPQAQASAQRTSSYGGRFVVMRSPDGSMKSVPADQVAHFQSLGATVVEGAA